MTKGYRKRLSAPKTRRVNKKSYEWTVKAEKGPHPAEESVPLKLVIRDHLELTENGKEAERVIKEGKIKIDGKTIRNHKYPVGFMDVLTIDTMEKSYRANFDEHGKIGFIEIDSEEAKHKLGRVKKKHKIKGGETQITLHDGKTLIKDDVNTGDSIKITLPEKEIEKTVKMKEGNLGYIVSGKHAGEIKEITGIMEGTSQRKPLVELGKIKTEKENIFPIGKKEPEVKIGE